MAFRAKLQFFYSLPNNGAFSEVWYTNDATYDGAIQSAKDYIAVRKELLGYGGNVVGARVSDDNVKGDSLLVQVLPGKASKSDVFISAEDIADKAGMAMQIRLEAGPLHRRQWLMRGNPDTLFNSGFPGGFDIGLHDWLAKFQALTALLKGGKWAIRNLTAVGPPPVYALTTLTDAFYLRAGYRKPSRPFGLALGRRPA